MYAVAGTSDHKSGWKCRVHWDSAFGGGEITTLHVELNDSRSLPQDTKEGRARPDVEVRPSMPGKVLRKPERKVSIEPDKRKWHPSPIIGQLVLVTTTNKDGTSNVAPKNWISYMAFGPSLIALGCNRKHWTAKNILRSREFVINVPGVNLVDTIWEAGYLDHPRSVESTGLTPIPSLKVKPPRIEECRAHLECVLDKHFSYGDEVILLGRIVAASIDQEALEAKDPYEYL